MPSILLDTPIGSFIRLFFIPAGLRYPEEENLFRQKAGDPEWRPGFETVEKATGVHPPPRTSQPRLFESAQTVAKAEPSSSSPNGQQPSPEAANSGPGTNQWDNLIIVDWYDDNDSSNPIHWPKRKKVVVYFIINYVALVINMASAIYAPSQAEIQVAFGVSATVSSFGLGLFIVGYGVGPLLWSPLSEMPAVGRNIPYLASMAVFISISIPTALANDIGSLLAFRFLQGFFGSPALSTGGASLSDISEPHLRPYALYTWAVFSLAGPCIGNVMAGYTVPELGWRWSLWEILITTAPGLVLFMFLPETSASNILHRRAQRLKALTGKDCYVARPDVEMAQVTILNRFYRSLVVPWKINLLDPSIMFTSIYCGLIYAIYYSFFEFFPLVYGPVYSMSPGQTGLVLLCNPIAVVLAAIPYFAYIYYVINPTVQAGRKISPERRLLPALCASVFIPAGIFLFGWTARPSVHWMVPTIGVGFATAGFATILQSIFVYIGLAYPQYAASLFGGNGFVKALVAFAGVCWSNPLYHGMGLSKGMSLLGALCAICVSGIFMLYRWGEKLRSRSKFAT
ncbi:major facilitator superfamily domain-containing protein [Dactylonectria macrodidyma]|uniref:Major facilitator superfamily domain-containing protein n=1 Tax=Dactylonectria macrodidyma TaxID=307937 RepID=A0A9P9DS89_9HYPO|nr:major facilitator superfamily domain-containing protein [Dactylonectria macrodidyma]